MNNSSAIALVPLLVDIAPYAIAAIPLFVGWVAYELRAHRIVDIKQADLDQIDKLAETAAGLAFGKSETSLAGESIHVGSPIVAEVVNKVIADAPGALAKAGVTPDRFAAMVVGKIGNAQAQQAPAAPAKAA